AQRLGWTENNKGEKIEADLMERAPRDEWTFFGPAVVLHGRRVCKAKKPQCDACMLTDCCPRIGVESAPATASAPGKKTAKKASKKTAVKTSAKKPAVKTSGEQQGSGGAAVPDLPKSWRNALAEEFEKPYFAELQEFVADERGKHQIFPPEKDVYSAFQLTPYDQVNVLLLGQDPYHDDDQAHGLCFSVQPGIKTPPSLKNMYKELKTDVGCEIPNHGYLVPWAEQGMLMLNTVLTVRAHQANSHKSQGWEKFTDAVIRKVNEKQDPVVFVLWGKPAQKKLKLIDEDRHAVIQSAHPSPLSASRGFFGSKPFSSINQVLRQAGKPEINWALPDR
ncbi:MAG: uracil-DNA glycosylase, partial [Planctomycetales bacterium]